MNNQEITDLLNRYHQEQCTPEEKAFVETWYQNIPEEGLHNTMEELTTDLDEVESYLVAHSRPRKTALWPRITAAAAVLIIVAASLFYVQQRTRQDVTANVYKNDVAPGNNKAYLTLADGSKIALDDVANRQLATQSGMKVSTTKKGRLIYTTAGEAAAAAKPMDGKVAYNTISTSRGGQYQVELADGTKVWLNAASSLTYPSSFASAKNRVVTLSGEAYFEVAKDKNHPFQVKSAGQVITVLGTHFNISSYTDESSTRTTLLEGLVSINRTVKNTTETSMPNPAGEQIIHPGQQAVLSEKNIAVQQVNVEEAVAWKNGYFRFNDENIQSVMRKLSRWYNIEVTYQGQISTEGFNGKISRFNQISEVLNALESTKTIHFKVEGRRVTVIK